MLVWAEGSRDHHQVDVLLKAEPNGEELLRHRRLLPPLLRSLQGSLHAPGQSRLPLARCRIL